MTRAFYKGAAIGLFFNYVALCTFVACKAPSAQTVETGAVLTLDELECIESQPDTENALQKAETCLRQTPTDAVVQFVSSLLEEKKAARRAGFVWRGDAGASAKDGAP